MRHDLTLSVPGFAIPAALEIPDGEPAGAVLLIPGSLLSDVNGDYPAWKIFPRVYAHLAEQMAERGLVAYRFAKLGPGTGSTEVATGDPRILRTWAGRMQIARAALAHFRAELAARRIAVPRFVLAGHSEGAVVASVIAATGADADGVVLLSGPSVGILGMMIEQSRDMLPPGAGDAPVRLLERMVEHIRKRDPIPDELRDARGAKPTTFLLIPGVQHMYKPIPEGATPMEIFGLAGPTDPRVAEAIDNFVRAL